MGAACTTVLVGTALSPSSHSRTSTTPDTTGGQAAASSNGTAGVQQEQLQQQQLSGHGTAAVTRIAADEHQVYSEVHDSCGSRVFIDTHDSAKASTPHTGAGEARQQQPPAKRRSSFRRAAHHPAGEALPRVSGVGEASTNSTAADMQAAADANASLFAQWRSDSSSMGGSMCSLVSAGTWTTGGTGISGTDTAGSDCTEDTAGSIYEELETVFNMTGVSPEGWGWGASCAHGSSDAPLVEVGSSWPGRHLWTTPTACLKLEFQWPAFRALPCKYVCMLVIMVLLGKQHRCYWRCTPPWRADALCWCIRTRAVTAHLAPVCAYLWYGSPDKCY